MNRSKLLRKTLSYKGLLLDRIGSGLMALSTSKLRRDYSGACLRVRRDSDNTEQDIGFSGGSIDTTQLLDFVGNNNGYVPIWYDQSTNNNDAVINNNFEQPQIVNNGSIIENSNGIGLFFGNDDFYTIPNKIEVPSGSDFTFFSDVEITNMKGANPGFWRSGDGEAKGDNFMIVESGLYPWMRWGGADILRPSSGYEIPTNQTIGLVWVVQSGTSAQFYSDTDLKTDSPHTKTTPSFIITRIGYQFNTAEKVEGIYNNFIFLSKALSQEEVSNL